MNKLEIAIQLATKAHAGQVDKADQPYILHPLRVMFSLKSEDQQIVGVLHDTLEDTYLVKKDLSDYFPNHIVDAVDALTRREDESYSDYIERVQENPLAAAVKLADLRDNMDLSRIERASSHDFRRWQKYQRTYGRIERGLRD